MDIEKLRAQLIQHEGLKPKIYRDSLGFWTIGIGHNLSSKGLTTSQIMRIFEDDVKDVVNFLNLRLPWWNDLDDVRQRALADLTFNLMGKVLDFKKMLDHLQHGEWGESADELLNSTFATQVGQRAKDLAFMIRTGTDA